MAAELNVRDLLDSSTVAEMRNRHKRLAVLDRRCTDQWEQLLQDYRFQWVAFGEGGVLASAEDLDELIEQIDEKGLANGVMVFHYLDPDPPAFLL